MNRTLIRALTCALALTAATASTPRAQTPEAAAEKLEHFLGRFPDLGPGYGVVVVTPDDVVLRHVQGARRAGTGAPLETDTPMYIASQTKAYVGLLAARLDEEGILGLNDLISDHWPDLQLPEGVDPSRWYLQDLLAHNVPITCGYITGMEAYVTELASEDYPALLERYASRRPEGHRYDNLGYNVWAAILEKATGKSWRVWLDEKLFGPLGMERTSSRTSDFSLDELSWNHIWLGEEEGWYDVRPKTDAMMQSAGGLVTSLDDMAIWLQLHLGGDVGAKAGITPAMVERTREPASETDPSEHNSYELPCRAYGLGWSICEFDQATLYIHGGGYTGARTMMAYSLDLGVGIGVFSNSDNMTGWLTSRTVVQYLQYLTGSPDAEYMAERRAEVYTERIARLLDGRRNDLEAARADESWGGWGWEPSAGELALYVGTWETDDPYLTARIELVDGELVGSIGDSRNRLVPAREDLFGACTDPLSVPEPVRFRRGDDGRPDGLEWDGRSYRRSAAPSTKGDRSGDRARGTDR